MATATVSPFVRPIGITASIIAIVQGIVWIILSLCAILIHLNVWDPNLTPSTYGQALSAEIISVYLTDGHNAVHIVHPLTFFIWAIIYLVISILWTGISSFQLYALMVNKHDLIKLTFLGWAICTIGVCISDLVLTILLAIDYNYIVQEINITLEYQTTGGYTALACGIIMILAARGFVLWIINVTFSAIVIKLALTFSNKVPQTGYSRSESANAYVEINSAGQGFNNPNYNTWEANKPDFTRSDSFVAAPSRPAPDRLPQLPPIATTNERLAKIGRQGGTSPPHNVAPPRIPQAYAYSTPPRIPSPDYSPPNSPPSTLKSALKKRNQNMYGYSNNRY